MPTGYTDFFFNYLLKRTYWVDTARDEVIPRITPIVAFKLGRRQFGLLSPITYVAAAFTYPLIVKQLFDFIDSMVDWFLGLL